MNSSIGDTVMGESQKAARMQVNQRAGGKKTRASKPNTSPGSPAAQAGPHLPEKSYRNQYHHYIPRFVLRNFALDDHVKHARERQDIYHYSLTNGHLRIARVDTTYGVSNMYSDIRNVSDINYVEKELGKLEQIASDVVKQLLNPSKSEFTITATELDALKKFLFIMSFRHPRRQQQYVEGRFDIATKARQEKFMKTHNLSTFADAWLENIKIILGSDLLPSKEDNILEPSRWKSLEQTDFWFHNIGTFVCIWEAPEPYEFIVTDNSFGIWEGNCGPGMWSQAYHHFYPVSPRRIIVLSKVTYKKDEFIGSSRAEFDNSLGLSTKNSLFPEHIHNLPIPQYPGKPPGVGLYQNGMNPLSSFRNILTPR